MMPALFGPLVSLASFVVAPHVMRHCSTQAVLVKMAAVAAAAAC